MYLIWTVSGLYLVGIVVAERPLILFVLFMMCGMIFLSRNIIVLAFIGIMLRKFVYHKGFKIKYSLFFSIAVLSILIVVLGNRGLIRSFLGFWEYNTFPFSAFEILANERTSIDWPWYSSFRGIELAFNPLIEFISGEERLTSQQVVGPVYGYGIDVNGLTWNAFFSAFSTPYFSSGLLGVFTYGFIFRLLYQIKNVRFQYLHWLLFYFGFRQVFFEDPASVFVLLLWLV